MKTAVAIRRAVLAFLIGGASLGACTPQPVPTPSPSPPVALLPVEITGVGAFPPGRTSLAGLTIRLTEAGVATIGLGEGTLVITFTDAAGAMDAISLTGTPAVFAPGSLGITASLPARNVLLLSIVDSDPLNIEPVTISNLRLSASDEAAPGAIRATITECTGSLAGCAAERELASPGTVSAP